MNDVESVLLKIGYDLRNESSSYWRALPLYRESGNASSLRIAKDSGAFTDFAANIKGDLFELVQLSLGLSNIEEAKTWVAETGFSKTYVERKPKIVLDKQINSKYSDDLMPHFSFYESAPRNISLDIIKSFECGVCFAGKQNNRFVFVIRDEEGNVKGVAGRDLIGGRVKWKLMGDKRKWVFPLSSIPYIEENQEVWLVESIGDMLALYDAGVKNVLVTFGIDISNGLVNFLATLPLKKLFISPNNDSSKEKNWGALGAVGIAKKLSKLIDENKIIIALPPAGDWGEMERKNRTEYVEQIRNQEQ